jgi:hypothetical protein
MGDCRGLFDAATNLEYSFRYARLALNRGSIAYYNAGIHARAIPHSSARYARAIASNAR